MSHVPITKIRPLSGFLTGHDPARSSGFYAGMAVVLLIWSVTPAAWATVLWRIYRKGTPFSLPTRNFFAQFWYVYSLMEIPFSIYFRYLTIKAARRPAPPAVSMDILHELLTKSLTAGLEPLETDKARELQDVKSLLTPANSQPSSSRNSHDGTAVNSGVQSSASSVRGLAALQSKRIEEDEARQRRERLRAWFFFAPLEEIYEDNVREWLAWAFTARNLDEAMNEKSTAALIDEGLEMVKLRVNWPQMKPGFNQKVRCIRLTLDPIRTWNRPLGFYVVVNSVSSFAITVMRIVFGFRIETIGRCSFLVKPAQSKRSTSSKDDRSLPIVFLHGLGIGLGQYLAFLAHLGRHREGVVIPIQPHISASIFHKDFLDPPGKDEQAKATIEVLHKLNMDKVTTISHSNGTMVLGWLLRTAPEMFVRNILVDPVSFCLWEGSVCYSFIYRRWSTLTEALLGYCVGRELGTAHTIGRRFIWFDMLLWSDEFPATTPDKLHIIFGERDILVDVPGSVRYLRESGIPDECISIIRDYQHGQALIENGYGMKLALKHAGVQK